MLYRREARRQLGWGLKNTMIAAVVAAIAVVGSLNHSIIIAPIQNFAVNLSAYFEGLGSDVSGFRNILGDNFALQRENKLLSDQYSGLALYCAAALESAEKSKNELEKALGRRSSSRKILVSAFLIGKPPIAPYGTFIIDAGEGSGIKVGDLAVAGDYVLGKVSSVSAESAVVSLFGENGSKENFLIGEKRVSIVGNGAGNGRFTAEYVGQGDVKVGEMVRLSDYPDLIYGVTATSTGGGSKFDISIVTPVNVFELASIDIISYESL